MFPTARRTGFSRYGDNCDCWKPRTHQQVPAEAHELSLIEVNPLANGARIDVWGRQNLVTLWNQ
jgi:hypothetical protein